VERLDRVKADASDGEIGIRDNHFSSPEVSNIQFTLLIGTAAENMFVISVICKFFSRFPAIFLWLPFLSVVCLE